MASRNESKEITRTEKQYVGPRPRFRSLCESCEELLCSFFPCLSRIRWKTLSTSQRVVFHCKGHLDGFVTTLRRSADSGCGLCGMILKRLKVDITDDAKQTYSIIHRKRSSPRLDIEFAVGDAQQFLGHIGDQWRPEKIIFYTRQHSHEQADKRLIKSRPPNYIIPRLHLLPEHHYSSNFGFSRAKRWMQICRETHKECHQSSQTCVPTRLLDLRGGSDLSKLKLYISAENDSFQYTTLSYSWGSKDEAERMKTNNEDDLKKYCQGIEISKLPQTLREFLYVSRRLGFDFAWIDAFCIIQHDGDDFAREVSLLSQTYGNAALNISASSGRHCNSGFLQGTPEAGIQIGVLDDEDISGAPTLIWAGTAPSILDLDAKVISTRGWVFQERLVSPATIHYADEGMIWECLQGTSIDHDQDICPVQWKAQWQASTAGLREAQLKLQAHKLTTADKGRHLKRWFEWICAYSARNLTQCTDKFPAIAGVAKEFATALDLSYVAGLWEHDLLSGLLWRRHNQVSSLSRYETFVAPSWSWGSVHGRLDYRHRILKGSNRGPVAKVLQVKVDQAQAGVSGAFGAIRYGEVTVEGYLQPVVVDKSMHPSVRKQDFQECGVAEGFRDCRNVLVMLDVFTSANKAKFTCFCLRLGSFDAAGRLADTFLLLERHEDCNNTYRRIGLAETDPWDDVLNSMPDSGYLLRPEMAKIVLV